MLELVQIRKDGVLNYLKQGSNWIDIIGLISYITFVYYLAYLETETQVHGYKEIILYIKFILVFQTLLKVNFYLQVNPKFGLLVKLVVTCIWDIKEFNLYLLIWIAAFTIAYKVLGMESTGYQGLTDNSPTNFMFQVWENSIGNIGNPAWASSTTYSTTQVVLIYLTWLFNQFLVLIVLLNFLIAVIS